MNTILTPQQSFDLVIKQNKEKNTSCLFCLPPQGMTLYETENMRLLIDNFPVTPGHIMISSKTHFGSLGEVSPSEIQEVETLKNKVKKSFSCYIWISRFL